MTEQQVILSSIRKYGEICIADKTHMFKAAWALRDKQKVEMAYEIWPIGAIWRVTAPQKEQKT